MGLSSPTAPVEAWVSEHEFRAAAGHFASGVAVITTRVGGRLYGTTASAVTSLSMDPPMMLVCLNRTSTTHDAIYSAESFGISILAENQGGLARQFAAKGANKFDGVDYDDVSGMPLLSGAIAGMVCQTESTTIGGTHTVFLARVSRAATSAGAPLAYFRGGFGSFLPHAR